MASRLLFNRSFLFPFSCGIQSRQNGSQTSPAGRSAARSPSAWCPIPAAHSRGSGCPAALSAATRSSAGTAAATGRHARNASSTRNQAAPQPVCSACTSTPSSSVTQSVINPSLGERNKNTEFAFVSCTTRLVKLMQLISKQKTNKLQFKRNSIQLKQLDNIIKCSGSGTRFRMLQRKSGD